MIRKHIKPIVATLLVASTLPGFAGDQLYDFDVGGNPASGDPTSVPGFVLFGNRALSIYQYFDGNPAAGGYLQLTDPAGSESAGVLFPDVDLYTNSLGDVISLPVKAFKIEMDMRIGNGTRRPADGFSINFCRPTDNSLRAALQPTPGFSGWAGGDSVATANDPNASGNPETGTRTGLAISFDTWQGNWIHTQSDVTTNANGTSNDKEGITVRLDDFTLIQVLMTNRNGGCFITELNPGDPCIAVSQAATDSMQTGPWSGPSANTGDGGVSDGTYNNLSWQRFTAEVDAQRRVTVTWKGATILDHYQLANYPVSQGRLILACRTGGSWEQTHMDNVHITTTPSVQPIFQSFTGTTNGFRINIQNVGVAQTTNFPLVTLDGTNVTSSVVVSNYLDVTTHGIYSNPIRFAPRSTHNVTVVFQDATGGQFTNTASFTVPPYLDLQTSSMIPLAQINTAKQGFKVKSYQGYRSNPNQLRWSEEQVIGLRGPNSADQAAAVGGYFDSPGPVHFSNGGGGSLFPGTANAWTVFGIGDANFPTPSVADNSAVEMTGYMYFPTNGFYVMYLGSDDGYRVSFASNPLDRMGPVVAEFDGGRGLAEPGDLFLVNVPTAGCYPVRLLWENGGGGADLQWINSPDGTYALINDINNPASVLVYAEALPAASVGAYVKSANPVRDGQNVVFYQPIVVDLGNGSGTRTVNSGSIVLSVDGSNQTLTVTSPDSSTTRLVTQMGTNVWSVGSHTILLTFSDNAGNNYSYTWPFSVINVPASSVIPLPLASMVPAASVDATKPGFRVKSWQSPQENPNHLSWTEMQLQGLKGPNVADQSLTGGTGYFPWGDQNTGNERDGILDVRYSSGTGAGGEWLYNGSLTAFGIGNNTVWTGTGLNAYRFNFAANAAESSAMDIGFWVVFPSAGTYILHVNSDDGEKMLATSGSPFSKLGVVLTEANAGRGVQGASGGQVGGDYRAISVPAAGAYPFRIVYENGGTDGGIEFSSYQVQPNGGIAKVPVNMLSDPTSLKVYQTLTAGDVAGSYVSYANPTYNSQETTFWQPVMFELTDGPGAKTVNSASIDLKVDNISRTTTVTHPSAGVTRVVQSMGNTSWNPGSHTAVLTYADTDGTSHTNTWPFTVITLTPFQNNQPAIVVDVPASSMVPVSSIDHNQPGFRVYPHQTQSQANNNTIQWTEEQFLGLHGGNDADLSAAVNGEYFVLNDVVDFADGYSHVPGFSGYDTDSSNGEFRYNYPFSRFGFLGKGGGVNTNDVSLIFAGYMEFPQAGIYAMTVNSDDGFKVTVPQANPRSQAGTILGWVSAGRGNTTGAGFGPRGNITHFVFRIPQAGAYPIRCIYENGGGGVNVEWTIYQFLANGSVARMHVGETNTPAIKIYQDSSLSGPYITSMNPAIPYQLLAGDAQTMRVGRGQDIIINLHDGNTTLTSASLTVGGVTQPVDVSQPGGGVTTVTRFGTNALPPGYYGPATLTYTDSASRSYSYTFTILNSDFYGTVHGAFAPGSGDPAKRGFLWRTYQVDGAGTTVLQTHAEAAQQAIEGIWTNNFANLTSNTINGYFVLAGDGTDFLHGLVNFNQDAPSTAGNFTSGSGFTDQQFPGMPGFSPRNLDSFVGEATTYIEFPTNGTYVMGVSSDDGFRVSRGFGGPVNNGALVVNSPASIAGQKPAVATSLYNTDSVSTPHTNVISGQIVQALGIGSGSTTAAEACGVTNAAQLAGKIALVYRGTCGFAAKVKNAVDAGAIAVVIVQDRPVVNASEGWFPTEASVVPQQPIPAIMIKRRDGDAIVQALSNNTAVVNVTLKPMADIVNPPANSAVLGQASWGKGASDILFNVTVPEAGLYPIRLLWQEGGGGANCEWFSMVDGTRVLVNDDSNLTGQPGLKAYYGLTVLPTVNLQVSGNNATINYTGTLQMADKVDGPWVDVYGQPPYTISTTAAASRFFRSR